MDSVNREGANGHEPIDAQSRPRNGILQNDRRLSNLISQERRMLKKMGLGFRHVGSGKYCAVTAIGALTPLPWGRSLGIRVPACDFCHDDAVTLADGLALCRGCDTELRGE
jgi:hypothetical protein